MEPGHCACSSDPEPHELCDMYSRAHNLLEKWSRTVRVEEEPLFAELTALAFQCFTRVQQVSPPPLRITDPAVEDRQLSAALDYQNQSTYTKYGRRILHTVSAEIATQARAAGPRLRQLWTVALRNAFSDLPPSTGSTATADPAEVLHFSLQHAAITALDDVSAPAGANGRTVAYAWAHHGQKDGELNRQVARLAQAGYPLDEVVTETTTRIDATRPRLLRLLANPDVTIVLAGDRDIVTPAGFDYIQAALAGRGAEILLLDEVVSTDEGKPGRAGQRWSQEDYRQLVACVRKGRTPEETAALLRRKTSAITSRYRWLLPYERGWDLPSDEALSELRSLLSDPSYDWACAVRERQQHGT